MRDIKVEQIKKVSIVENNETKEIVTQNTYVEKKESFVLGKVLLSTLCLSVFTYLFFVTSTIYYALNTQKVAHSIENLKIDYTYNSEDTDNYFTSSEVAKKDRVTFINVNSDAAISLR